MYHYKDQHPIRNVNNIRQILKQIEVLPIEDYWKHSIKEIYSLRLIIPGINVDIQVN